MTSEVTHDLFGLSGLNTPGPSAWLYITKYGRQKPNADSLGAKRARSQKQEQVMLNHLYIPLHSKHKSWHLFLEVCFMLQWTNLACQVFLDNILLVLSIFGTFIGYWSH